MTLREGEYHVAEENAGRIHDLRQHTMYALVRRSDLKSRKKNKTDKGLACSPLMPY